jgi:hypothetical protein
MRKRSGKLQKGASCTRTTAKTAEPAAFVLLWRILALMVLL